jgi:hypothetical protein
LLHEKASAHSCIIVCLFVVGLSNHSANHSTQDMPPAKLKNWGKAQKEECVKQFNLFVSSNGADGWNPQEVDDSYIRPKLKLNDLC